MTIGEVLFGGNLFVKIYIIIDFFHVGIFISRSGKLKKKS